MPYKNQIPLHINKYVLLLKIWQIPRIFETTGSLAMSEETSQMTQRTQGSVVQTTPQTSIYEYRDWRGGTHMYQVRENIINCISFIETV